MNEIKERAIELWKKLPIISEDWIPVIEDALKEQKFIDDKELQLREETLFENICEWIGEHYESYAAQSRGNAGVAATMTLVALREAREKGEITDKEE